MLRILNWKLICWDVIAGAYFWRVVIFLHGIVFEKNFDIFTFDLLVIESGFFLFISSFLLLNYFYILWITTRFKMFQIQNSLVPKGTNSVSKYWRNWTGLDSKETERFWSHTRSVPISSISTNSFTIISSFRSNH